MEFSSRYATCAGREIHYTEWGPEHGNTVIAWHGLARTCRDMDDLARHLCGRYRVICPDTLGRGLSQWSPDPGREYNLAFYAQLAADLFDHLGIDRFLSEARALTNLIGNGVATIVVAKWEGALDTDRMHRHLNNETDAEADSPESVLVEEEETAGIGTGRGTAGAPSTVRA